MVDEIETSNTNSKPKENKDVRVGGSRISFADEKDEHE